MNKCSDGKTLKLQLRHLKQLNLIEREIHSFIDYKAKHWKTLTAEPCGVQALLPQQEYLYPQNVSLWALILQ